MLNLRFILIALVILASARIALSQENFPDVNALLKSHLKGEDQLSVEVKGDLNNDGVEDWVGVIHGQQPDAAPTYQLFVLLKLSSGGYQLAVNTEKAEIAGMGCCWLEDLAIRRGSIFIQNNAKTASTMEAATHQFKLIDGQWRLIGLKIYLTDHTPEAPKTQDTDMNLLTGSIIEKTQNRQHKPITRRRYKKFPVYLLKDFDFFNGFGAE